MVLIDFFDDYQVNTCFTSREGFFIQVLVFFVYRGSFETGGSIVGESQEA